MCHSRASQTYLPTYLPTLATPLKHLQNMLTMARYPSAAFNFVEHARRHSQVSLEHLSTPRWLTWRAAVGVQLLMPSPVYPSQHSQAKLPFVSMQAAFVAQLSVPRRHSLMLMVQSGPSILQAATGGLLSRTTQAGSASCELWARPLLAAGSARRV